MAISSTPWELQKLESGRNGYPDWATFAIRDKANYCLAVIGEVDRATSEHNAGNAALMLAAPDLLAAVDTAEEALGENLVWLADKLDLQIRQKDAEVIRKLAQLEAAWKALALAKAACARV